MHIKGRNEVTKLYGTTFNEEIRRKKSISLNKIFLGTHAKKMSQDCIQLHGVWVGKRDDWSLFFKNYNFLLFIW